MCQQHKNSTLLLLYQMGMYVSIKQSILQKCILQRYIIFFQIQVDYSQKA